MKIVTPILRGDTIHNLDFLTDAQRQLHAPTLVPVFLTLHLPLHLHQVLGQGRVPEKPRRKVIHRIALRHFHDFGERVGNTKNGTDELTLRVMRSSVCNDTCTFQEVAEACEVVGALELFELRTCNAAHEQKVERLFSREHAMVDRGSRASALNRPNPTRARYGSQIFGSGVAH